VVGLGLRNLAHCPVELNLMPESSIQRQEFQSKKPFLIAAIFTLVAVAFAVGYFFQRSVSLKQTALEELRVKVQPMMVKKQEMDSVQGELNKLKTETDKAVALIEDRFYWPEVINELRRIFIAAEEKAKQKVGTDTGIWIETFAPVVPQGNFAASGGPQPVSGQVELPPELAARYGERPPDAIPAPAAPSASGNPNEIAVISMVCRGVDLEQISPAANSDLAYAVKAEVAASPFFVPDAIELEPIKKEENSPTFTFGMVVKLKRPLKYQYTDQ
jgi:hypothetical protein